MRTAIVTGIVLFVIAGCGARGPVPQPVSGAVTLDRAPLKEGKIYFVSETGSAPVAVDVADGRFSLQAVPGKYRVEVRMFKDRIPWPGEPHDKKINTIPARFNAETTLVAQVEPSGANDFTFAIESR